MKVLLDAGHGIETPGKRSPDGLFREYKYCRELATLVKERLQKLGIDVIYICEGVETDTKLKDRCKLINAICRKEGARNCVSISIHNNAATSDGNWHDASGWSVYVSLNASEYSKRLASLLFTEAKKAKILGNRRTPSEGYKAKNLAMCRDTNCPAVLIENMFQDNKQDVAWMLTEEGKQTLVDVIVNGVKKYIQSF